MAGVATIAQCQSTWLLESHSSARFFLQVAKPAIKVATLAQVDFILLSAGG